jgi:hypothetical protein
LWVRFCSVEGWFGGHFARRVFIHFKITEKSSIYNYMIIILPVIDAMKENYGFAIEAIKAQSQ